MAPRKQQQPKAKAAETYELEAEQEQPKAEENEPAKAVPSNPGEVSVPKDTGPTITKRPDGRIFEDY